MSTRFRIAALIFAVVQAVVFGVGTVLVLATPLKEQAATLMPAVVIGSLLLSVPLSWAVAARMRARYAYRFELRPL